MNTQNDSSKLTVYKAQLRTKTFFFHQCWRELEQAFPYEPSVQRETVFFVAAFLRLQCIRLLYDQPMSKRIRGRIFDAFDQAMGFFLLEWIESHVPNHPERTETMSAARMRAYSKTIGQQVIGYIPLCRAWSDQQAEHRAALGSPLPRLVSEDRFLDTWPEHPFRPSETLFLSQTIGRYTSVHLPDYIHLLRSEADRILSAFGEAFGENRSTRL